jgi:transposase InsO family protein
MLKIFKLGRSGYYAWCGRKMSLRTERQCANEVIVKAAHTQTRETYGYRRLHSEVIAQGHKMSQWQVRRTRQRLGLRCKQSKKFKVTTQSNHDMAIAPNLLNQQFNPSRPNEVWVTDITYVWTDEGWLYLAGVKDVYTCEIVGYAMSSRMTKELCMSALQLAVVCKKPAGGLIHHSDRGSQYCSKNYQEQLKKNGMKASMSRKGNCYDNAPMESFWGSLKNELVHHTQYKTRQQAQNEITEYIEIFYNRQRRHSRLGNVSPAQFAKLYWQSDEAVLF